jgi:hypothetical protein
MFIEVLFAEIQLLLGKTLWLFGAKGHGAVLKNEAIVKLYEIRKLKDPGYEGVKRKLYDRKN